MFTSLSRLLFHKIVSVFQVLKRYYLKIISTILHPSEWASVLARYPRYGSEDEIPFCDGFNLAFQAWCQADGRPVKEDTAISCGTPSVSGAIGPG
ncbi:MAG: hypothetical protein A2157_18420 [Deltaproteobacteria bacterium RBG_16_47_11]|nr:MAG: hypothetical protein A2157_18420 [Deltaproteobacteria bacterium RBG_16_47_11]